MKINENWHRTNPMPKSANLRTNIEQRIKWHLEHKQRCACHGIPAKLLEEIKNRKGEF